MVPFGHGSNAENASVCPTPPASTETTTASLAAVASATTTVAPTADLPTAIAAATPDANASNVVYVGLCEHPSGDRVVMHLSPSRQEAAHKSERSGEDYCVSRVGSLNFVKTLHDERLQRSQCGGYVMLPRIGDADSFQIVRRTAGKLYGYSEETVCLMRWIVKRYASSEELADELDALYPAEVLARRNARAAELAVRVRELETERSEWEKERERLLAERAGGYGWFSSYSAPSSRSSSELSALAREFSASSAASGGKSSNAGGSPAAARRSNVIYPFAMDEATVCRYSNLMTELHSAVQKHQIRSVCANLRSRVPAPPPLPVPTHRNTRNDAGVQFSTAQSCVMEKASVLEPCFADFESIPVPVRYEMPAMSSWSSCCVPAGGWSSTTSTTTSTEDTKTVPALDYDGLFASSSSLSCSEPRNICLGEARKRRRSRNDDDEDSSDDSDDSSDDDDESSSSSEGSGSSDEEDYFDQQQAHGALRCLGDEDGEEHAPEKGSLLGDEAHIAEEEEEYNDEERDADTILRLRACATSRPLERRRLVYGRAAPARRSYLLLRAESQQQRQQLQLFP